MAPRKLPHRWYIGYEISTDNLELLVCSILNISRDKLKTRYINVLAAWVEIRHKNPEIDRHLPKHEFRYQNPDPRSRDLNDQPAHYVFPTRSLVYKDDTQLDDDYPDSKFIKSETDRDKVYLDDIVKSLESLAKMSRSDIRGLVNFTYIKNLDHSAFLRMQAREYWESTI